MPGHDQAACVPGHDVMIVTVQHGFQHGLCVCHDKSWCAAGKYVLKCLLSPDVRQLATASADKTVKLWNLDGFTLERTLTGVMTHTIIVIIINTISLYCTVPCMQPAFALLQSVSLLPHCSCMTSP